MVRYRHREEAVVRYVNGLVEQRRKLRPAVARALAAKRCRSRGGVLTFVANTPTDSTTIVSPPSRLMRSPTSNAPQAR